MKEYPSVNVRVEYRRANLVYEDVLHGSVDLGLVAFPNKHKELQVIPFAQDELSTSHASRTYLGEEEKRQVVGSSRSRLHRFRAGYPDS